MAKYKVSDFIIGGKFSKYFWDLAYNPNATVIYGLANCTTLTVGMTYINGQPYPVSRITNADQFHTVLINGWTCIPYDRKKLKVGDIIEWTSNCHVCTVADISDDVYVHSSWYTGEHGRSTWNRKPDTRYSIQSLQELSDIMSTKYPYRFYHYTDIDTECDEVGGQPQYILRAPDKIVDPVERNKSIDQIKVNTNEQNVRTAPNGQILGSAQSGFYNVLNEVKTDYVWYEVEPDRWIAGVEGRVEFLEGDSDYKEVIRMLTEENTELRNRLGKIHDLSEV